MRPFALLPLLLVAALSACAAWQKHGVDLTSHPPLRVALLPLSVKVKVKDPNRVSGELAVDISDGLRESEDFDLVSTVLGVSTVPYTSSQLKAMGRQFDAQVLLQVEVGGYGKLKATTVIKHIGFSAVRGTVEGAIVAGPAGPLAGAVVLAYSILEGTAIWLSGTFVFNHIYSPVILDARMYSAVDGEMIWHGSEMAVINREALDQLPEKKRKDREARLSLTAEKAAAKLVAELVKDARYNLKSQLKKLKSKKPGPA